MSADTMTDAERFFFDRAGSSYDPKTQTEEQGRLAGARLLARAEARMTAGPYVVQVEPDDQPWDGDVPWDGPIWYVALYREFKYDSLELLGSLGGVACEEGDPYLRVVAAELALEYLPTMSHEFARLIDDLAKATRAVSEFWDGVDVPGHHFGDAYPYGADLGEVAYAVEEWANLARQMADVDSAGTLPE